VKALELARELIARKSVTPADDGCQSLLAARLSVAGYGAALSLFKRPAIILDSRELIHTAGTVVARRDDGAGGDNRRCQAKLHRDQSSAGMISF
jgi:hypothetical protein